MDITGQKFIRAAETDDQRLVVCTQAPGMDIETQPHTGLVYWSEDEGWCEIGLANGVTADATVTEDKSQALVTDPFGLVHVTDGGVAATDAITDERQSPPEAPIRAVRHIAGHVYAVGVERQAYMRTGGKWRMISTDDVMTSEKPVAFQAVDGFSENEIYTAGWDGEIWSFDGNAWEQRESPTNIILNDIAAGPDVCIAVGLAGQIIMGRGDNWEMIEQDETDEDFWSVRAFNGAFYITALSGIYELRDGEFALFRDTDEEMRTVYALSTGPSGLWSVGLQDIVLFDGNDWKTIGQS